MKYLSKNVIVLTNKKTVSKHGGQYIYPYNFLNEGSLNYLIEMVSSELFGKEIYPTISEKAGFYMYNIISNHIFCDGNKRTGLEASILFLDLNGFRISKTLPKEEIYNFTMKVAAGQSNLEECQAWFEQHIVEEYLQ